MSQTLPNGVMLNAYPDSMGSKLSDAIELLRKPEFKDAFPSSTYFPRSSTAISIADSRSSIMI